MVYLPIALLLSILVLGANGYLWEMVFVGDPYPEDMVLHVSVDFGSQGCCRIDMMSAGRADQFQGVCYIPYYENQYDMLNPFEVVVEDTLSETLVFTSTPEPLDVLRDIGVLAFDIDCSPQPETYICGHIESGPGKLVVEADEELICYIAYNGVIQPFTDYQVLIVATTAAYNLTKVNYHLNDLLVLSDSPLNLAEAILSNRDDQPLEVVHTLTYDKASTSKWHSDRILVDSATMTVKGGVPFFTGASWKVNDGRSFDYLHKSSYSETVQASREAKVVVPANHSCRVGVVGHEMKVDVPYDATVTAYHKDGHTVTKQISGTYTGQSVTQETITIEECLPITE